MEHPVYAILLYQEQCSAEAMRHMAGYVQRKAEKQFPGLSIPKGEEEDGGWLEKINRGGLTIPCEAFLALCQKLEQSFISFHGEGISKAPNAIDLLSRKVSIEYDNIVLKYICNLYLKVRFFNRIKYLNNILKRKEAAEKIRDNIFLWFVLFTIGHKNSSVFKFIFFLYST